MPYQTLDARKLAPIVERLKRRIEERFPGSPLAAAGLVLLIVVGLAVMIYGRGPTS